MLLKFYCSKYRTIWCSWWCSITRMLWDNHWLNLSMIVFRKMFSNHVTQLLVFASCYQYQASWDAAPFAVLGTSDYVHIPTSEVNWITRFTSLIHFRYRFKFCKQGYNIHLFEVFILIVASTDDTWTGAEWQSRVMQMNQSQWTDQIFGEKDTDCEFISS